MGALIADRYGRLVPAFLLVALFIVQLPVDAIFGQYYFSSHGWLWTIVFLLAAGGCWLIGFKLRKNQPSPEIDPQSGREPSPGSAAFARYAMREIEKESAFVPQDTFLCLHISKWAYVLVAIGVLILIMHWIG